jgi:hypothetical protein
MSSSKFCADAAALRYICTLAYRTIVLAATDSRRFGLGTMRSIFATAFV